MEKTKILHVAQAAGGVNKYIYMLLKYMNKDKFENILVCSYDYNRCEYEGIISNFEQIEMQREIGLTDIKSILNVRKLIKKYNPNIVYAHSSKAGVIARIANIGLAKICIYNPHGWPFNMKCSKKKKYLYSMIEKACSHLCNKIICISKAEEQSAITNKICKSKKLQVIVNGIDISYLETIKKIKFTRQDAGIPEDAFVVGMVGRVSQQKSPDVFIKAASLIKKEIPNSYFVIVGNGDQEDLVKEIASKNGLNDAFLITGWVEQPMDYIKLFDVAMLLSRWEGFGLVLPEYMIAEKPIVATNVDAIPNIIENKVNGLLVEVDDIVSASSAVIELFKNDELREKLINREKIDVYKKYDAKRVSLEHEKLFYNLLN